MPPFRIPFTNRRPVSGPNIGPVDVDNEYRTTNGTDIKSPYRDKPSLALDVKGDKTAPNEFKMSSVNDSGEYLPPSPIERPSFWGKASHSTNSFNHRSTFTDNEPFSISRESFESYRRSFDISGRSPVFHSRSSLDSRVLHALPRAALDAETFKKPKLTEDEATFEDVGLNDEPKPKKKTFLSRFGETANDNAGTPGDSKTSPHHLHLFGRKRGQSGSGNELGSIERPSSKGKAEAVVR